MIDEQEYIDEAISCLEHADIKTAMSLSEQILHQNPYNTSASVIFGVVAYEVGNLKLAKKLFCDGLMMCESLPMTYINICELYLKQKRYCQLFDIQKIARSANPSNIDLGIKENEIIKTILTQLPLIANANFNDIQQLVPKIAGSISANSLLMHDLTSCLMRMVQIHKTAGNLEKVTQIYELIISYTCGGEILLQETKQDPSPLRNHNAESKHTILFVPSPVASGTLLLGQILSIILCEEYQFSDITYHEHLRNRPLMNYPILEFDYLSALSSVRNNAFLCQHYFYNKDIHSFFDHLNLNIVMMKRDPRDALVSSFNMFYHNDSVDKVSKNRKRYGSFDDFINNHLVEGARWYIDYYSSWKEVKNLYYISYEQIKVNGFYFLKKMFEHINMDIPHNIIYKALYHSDFRTLAKRDPGTEVKNPDNYLRSGIRGEWRSFFTSEQKQVLKRELGTLLIDLDYEHNYFW